MLINQFSFDNLTPTLVRRLTLEDLLNLSSLLHSFAVIISQVLLKCTILLNDSYLVLVVQDPLHAFQFTFFLPVHLVWKIMHFLMFFERGLLLHLIEVLRRIIACAKLFLCLVQRIWSIILFLGCSTVVVHIQSRILMPTDGP